MMNGIVQRVIRENVGHGDRNSVEVTQPIM